MASSYITQFYSWATGNTITATRLNGNVTNITNGLSGGTLDINVGSVEVGGTTRINGSGAAILTAITTTGDITSTGAAIDWDLIDNNASALSFDAAGKAGILAIVTTNSTEGVTMSGTLSVTGAATFTGGVTFDGGITLGAGDDLIGSSTSDITFNTNKFTVAGATGNTVIAGTCGITGVLTATAQSIHTNGLTDGTATLDGSGVWTGIASLTVDNLVINGNDITASTGAITLTPAAGSAVTIDGGASFDAGVVTGITSLTAGATVIDASGVTLAAGDDLIGSSTSDITINTNKFTVAGATGNTVIAGTCGVTGVLTATAGLTDGTATLDGSGAWTGITSLTVDNIVVNGNDISSSTGNLTLTPVGGSAVVIDGAASFDAGVLTGLTAVTATSITGTLQTAAQTNVTSLGTLSGLSISAANPFLTITTTTVGSNGSPAYFGLLFEGNAGADKARISATDESASSFASQLRFETSIAGSETLTEHLRIAADGGIFAYNLLAAAGSTDVNINGSSELHSVTSSLRFKENIREIEEDTSKIYDLNPVTYAFKDEYGGVTESGLIAEEAVKCLPGLVVLDEEGPYSVKYSRLAVYLIPELKKLRNRIAELEKKCNIMKG